MIISERSLLLRGATGDRDALREIWIRWSPRILLFLKGRISDEDREDLCQEIMLKVFNSLASYNPLWAPSTWIYTIASRCRIDYYRQKDTPLSESGYLVLDKLPSPILPPDEALVQKDTRERIRAFMDLQDERDKNILYLNVFEGMSGRKTAKALGMASETVRYRLKILKRQLKEVLDR